MQLHAAHAQPGPCGVLGVDREGGFAEYAGSARSLKILSWRLLIY
ncbi:hypothetical protein Sulac_0667 [Sulfobacillus acidophilus DSM 10332]|uniref:Uncharacterized protein n=1 Tax=Sulfobacillus acidophilus (strain ATCC 700253 / DSM 10332 / NAL) TaxID=679936 RepID=G8U008_SULAD|nr:hypothetical protein Sulac_0667 [Sulfobacillus acidophilus DSM 10332]